MAYRQNLAFYELKEPGELHDLLSATYKKIVIGLPAKGLTLVPKTLFNNNPVADFARFLDVKDSEKVFAQTLDDQNIIVYKTDGAIVSAIEKFDLQNTVYTAKGWIKAISISTQSITKLYLEIGRDNVQFLYFNAGILRFYNTFEISDEDDLAYFSSLVTGELNLNPELTTLVLSGEVEPGDKYMSRLAGFFRKVELNDMLIIDLPWHISTHKIMALAALTLCGSSEVL